MIGSAPGILRVGSRGSALARAQTDLIRAVLQRRHGIPAPELVVMESAGDRDQDSPLPVLGGRGIFTDELERELLAGRIDFAVHSFKDVPVDPTPGLVLAAICCRVDPRDVLVGTGPVALATLPPGARVGTCSTRRTAQLLVQRPDLEIVPLRGNVDTRLSLAASGRFTAIILAAAGLIRLRRAAIVSEWLSSDLVLPAPAQGALAVQCRDDDQRTRALLATLDDPVVRAATTAERAFLEGLGGGCLAPIAALANVRRNQLLLRGRVLDPTGARDLHVRIRGTPSAGRELGLALAARAKRLGATELLS